MENIRKPHHDTITIKENSKLSVKDYEQETDKYESPDIENIGNKSTSNNENTDYEKKLTLHWQKNMITTL